MKSNVLFSKIAKKKRVIEGFVHYFLFFPIFLAVFEFHVGKTTSLLRPTTSQPISRRFH